MEQNNDDHPFPFMQERDGMARREGNSVPLSSRNLQHLEWGSLHHNASNVPEVPLSMEEFQFSMPYGLHYYQTHQAPLAQVGRPVYEVGRSSSSRTLQDSEVQSLESMYEVRSSSSRILQDSSEMQSLESLMEALNLSNVNGFHDYETNQYHGAWLQHTRNVESANTRVPLHPHHGVPYPIGGVAGFESANTRVPMHSHHRVPYPIGGVAGPPSREGMVWPRTRYDVEPLNGQWVAMAKDPRGSRLLQQMIDEATPQENLQMVKELKYHLHELIKHPYGNFVVLKLFQSRNISIAQKNNLIFWITVDRTKLKDLCIHDQGSRVMQQILESEQVQVTINQVTQAMRCITVALTKNFNGSYVIQQCLKLFPADHKNAILDVVAQNCYNIAVNKCGCCIIQKCMQHEDVPAFFDLVVNLISNAEALAKDQYGNYVLQFLVKKNILEVNSILVLKLLNKYVELSTNKYASNVVEDLLHYSGNAAIIVNEIMHSPDFLQVVLHEYGNYVVQRALQFTQGPLHESLCDTILSNHSRLNSCLHGKKVLNVAVRGRRVRG